VAEAAEDMVGTGWKLMGFHHYNEQGQARRTDVANIFMCRAPHRARSIK
jgi:hypothetical protein